VLDNGEISANVISQAASYDYLVSINVESRYSVLITLLFVRQNGIGILQLHNSIELR